MPIPAAALELFPRFPGAGRVKRQLKTARPAPTLFKSFSMRIYVQLPFRPLKIIAETAKKIVIPAKIKDYIITSVDETRSPFNLYCHPYPTADLNGADTLHSDENRNSSSPSFYSGEEQLNLQIQKELINSFIQKSHPQFQLDSADGFSYGNVTYTILIFPDHLTAFLFCKPNSPQEIVLDINLFILLWSVVLIGNKGLLLHGSGLEHYGEIVAFLGHSNQGKSTLTRLNPHKQCYSDDTIAIIKKEDGFYVSPSPFYQYGYQARHYLLPDLPLKHFFFIHQSKELKIEKFSPGLQLLPKIAKEYHHFSRYFPASLTMQLLDTLLDLIRETNFYNLYFSQTDSTIFDKIDSYCGR